MVDGKIEGGRALQKDVKYHKENINQDSKGDREGNINMIKRF